MTSANRRKAERVRAGFPVELTTPTKLAEGEVQDLSRGGIRVRMASLALGITAEDAINAGSDVSDLLAESFILNLHHKRLGTLLPRAVRLTRVGVPTDGPGMLDLCCEFLEALGDKEADLLEIELPPFTESVEQWCEEDDLPLECQGELRFVSERAGVATVHEPVPTPQFPSLEREQRFRAFVSSTSPDAPPALFCHTDLVTNFAVRVRLTRATALGPHEAGRLSLQQASQAFVDLFGSSVDLRLVGTDGDLWSGPVRVCGIELPKNEPDEMLVTLSFDRKLRLSEMHDLGMERDAA